jgi:hypothetical protein
VVLDDAVEDDVDLARAVAVGMGVLLGDATVRGPARVGEPIVAPLRRPRRAASSARSATAAGRLARLPTARTESIRPSSSRETRRVVAAVLELLEARDQEIATRPPAHISDDAAHEDSG